MNLTAYDFETTGVDPKTCEPVQLGALKVTVAQDGSYETLWQCNTLLKPENPIPEGASNIHKITDDMVENADCPHETVSKVFQGGTVLGYNIISYDNVIAKRYGAQFDDSIDLFVGAMRLKTEGVLQRATLTAAYETLTGKKAENAHDATADVHMTLALIQPMMKHWEFETFSELVEFLQTSKGDVKMLMPFGKHKGRPLCNLPPSYVSWVKENLFLQGDLKESFDLL